MEIKGQIEEIVYTNEENSYTVCTLSLEDDTMLTAVGYLPFLSIGDVVILYGKMVNHNMYGEQFKVDTFEKVMPVSSKEIEKYLGSGIIKGVGPVTSKKIINKFGDNAIYVLRFEPYKLAEISGITSAKATQISDEFNKQWELWQIVIFLQKYGIGATNANRVYKEFGINAIQKIEENPYVLLSVLYGVDFKAVDKMAIDLGIDYDSNFRIASGIKYALQTSSRNGNTCVLKQNLLEYVSNILGVEKEVVDNEISALLISKEIYLENEKLFLKHYYEAEESVAQRLLMMCNDSVKKYHSLGEKISTTEKKLGITLSDEQKKAVESIFKNKVTIITGGPGTGKTTVIKTAITIMQKEDLDVALCAPTGRAAKRITETTGEEAKTLHRLLELGKTLEEEIELGYNVAKIDKDVVIVDEMSMVDIVLMHFLLRGLLDKTRLVLIGDSDQLPSVGPGNVLKDLIDSDMIPTVKLTNIYRQAAESNIITNAHMINNGEMIDLAKKDGDFFFMRGNDIVNQLGDLVSNRLAKYGDYDSMQDIQVLTPTKKGDTGTKNLNKELQKILNPATPLKKEKTFGDVVYREGDKVMQIKNNYDMYWESLDKKMYGSGVFNGDMGKINKISDEGIEVVFDEERVVNYDTSVIEELEHAYAVTIHKSQGSEFPVVVMPIVSGPPMLYTRNLLYTGVTRARELLVIVGQENIVNFMINNSNIKGRNTGLQYKLQKYMQIFSKM